MRYFPLILLLTACSTPLPIPDIDGKIFRFQVKLVDTLPEDYEGLHIYDEKLDLHTIILIRDNYPDCYLHEALHILDDDWHKGRVSTEYCYNR